MRWKALATAAVLTGALVVGWMGPRVTADGATALEGTVSAAGAGKLEGVLVTARGEGANFSVSVTSDAKGKYAFPRTHLAPGKYDLEIRAVGYDVAPTSVTLAAGKTAKQDLSLEKTKNLADQLSSIEWAMSMPGTDEVKNKYVYTALSCAYCHSYKRIMKSKHTPEQWVAVIKRMQAYYPDGTAASDDGRGRGQRELPFGDSLGNPASEPRRERPHVEGAPWAGFTGMQLPEYLSSMNLSGGRTTWDFPLKTLPLPKGKSTRVIVTEWDMPRKDTVSHDSDVDSKGNFWYTDESRQFVGVLDPKTNTITEYPLPPVSKQTVPGARDVVVDKDDNVWFSLRIDNGASVVGKFEPKTQKYTQVDGAYGQFLGRGGDGKLWTGTTIFHRIDPVAMNKDLSIEWGKSPNYPKGARIGCYQLQADSKGNPWCTGYVGSFIIGADAKTGESKFFPTPKPASMPRRNRMDAEDRIWFAEYTGDRAGMFDTKTEKFQEWDLPDKYATPYSSSIQDSKGRVYLSSNMSERVYRVDTKTGEVASYQMPGNFDSKKITIDKSTNKPVVWMANTRAARIVRVEPLD
jgi:streptogramin lyase/DNA-directed RNA polymerase subunit RPC12/RpoP